MAISLLEQSFLFWIEDPLVAAAQRASIFPFPGRGMDRSAVLRGGFLTPEMEKAGNDDERKGHAAELTNC
jgi:hypothetical protein